MALSELPEPIPDSRARHTRGSGRLSWRRIAVSVLDVIGNCAPGAGRKLVQGKERAASGRRLLEDCDWAVAAYEDASGAGWPALACEERPSVRPITGNTKQRSWRCTCLLARGSIELDSFFATHRG